LRYRGCGEMKVHESEVIAKNVTADETQSDAPTD
jgi:hypothetical protein